MSRIDELAAIARKETRTIVGLMSGTSLDGVDAALVEVSGSGPSTRVALVAFETLPFPPGVRERIEDALEGTVRDACELNFELGEVFADAVRAVAARAGVALEAVDLVASHGQTVFHVDRTMGRPSTLQVGEPAVIAERTGRIVVADFRTRDIAAGGGGAPLVAYVDHCLLARPGRTVLLQNIGGIANVTVVTPEPERVLAFDTGPGNVLIDEVCRELTGDEAAFDQGGALSALGEPDERLLAELLAHEYLRLAPPKTTGRELFGAEFAQRLVDAYDRDRLIDLLTTLVHFTARSIARAYREHVLPGLTPRPEEVVVSGGGVHNLTLMRVLTEDLARDGLVVRSFDDLGLGFSAKAKEAVAFAILANETVQGRPSNLPAATGARRAVIQGKLVL
ncbi:MAG: anhydro-N-acetylmuramic acid kinase [Planctomycetes bacterium]|nr:anhydro-N-acetylmuramic acid kinase [Planctomycetota bacterium]